MSRLYDEAGTRPMTDDELADAVSQYRADNPGDADYAGVELRIRRLNAEATERAEAGSIAVSLSTLQRAKAVERERDRRERDSRDLEKAGRHLRAATRGGPPPAYGLDIDRIRAALVAWPTNREWPPSQLNLCQSAFDGISERRLRQVMHDAHTGWKAELRRAATKRKGTSA
jgi:hypothetical protein